MSEKHLQGKIARIIQSYTHCDQETAYQAAGEALRQVDDSNSALPPVPYTSGPLTIGAHSKPDTYKS